MKKLIIASLILVSLALGQNVHAQVRVSINIGSQPAWGPTGYDYARYYYLPEANVYYDITRARFIYLSGNRWIYATSLPPSYGRFDLYNTYKVVVNRNYAPYRDNRRDRVNYARYKNVHDQGVIRDSRETKYYESKYHPKHGEWEKSHPGTHNDNRNNRRNNRR
ncbi:MAG: hypothetical protein QM640_12690 [Niabella sp.]